MEAGGKGASRPGPRPCLTAAMMSATHLQEDSDGNIECVNEERRLQKKVCNVSYPFFRAKAKVEAGDSREGPGWALGGTGSLGREARATGVNRRPSGGGRPEVAFICLFSHEMTCK